MELMTRIELVNLILTNGEKEPNRIIPESGRFGKPFLKISLKNICAQDARVAFAFFEGNMLHYL